MTTDSLPQGRQRRRRRLTHYCVANLVRDSPTGGTTPKMTMRWLRRSIPETRMSEIAAASVIAPVPCMSSLKVQMRTRYYSRMFRPLLEVKSSHPFRAGAPRTTGKQHFDAVVRR